VGPFLDGSVDTTSWRILPTVIAPTIMLILVFVLPLDITMAMVFMTGAPDAQRQQLKSIIKLEVALMMVLLLAWLPYFLRLFGR
jgi:hypothetical protein